MTDELNFVRKDFYIDPPDENATKEEWQSWMKADDGKAAAHKRAVTMAQEHCEIPEDLQEPVMRKIGGVWKQTLAIGFVGGDVEEGTTQAEPMQEAQQEHHIALVDMEKQRNVRGGTRKGKSARRRKNKRRRK